MPVDNVNRRVATAMEYADHDPDSLGDYCDWLLPKLLNDLGPEDLTPREKLAMVALLAPAQSRKLGTLGGRSALVGLRLVTPPRGDVSVTP